MLRITHQANWYYALYIGRWGNKLMRLCNLICCWILIILSNVLFNFFINTEWNLIKIFSVFNWREVRSYLKQPPIPILLLLSFSLYDLSLYVWNSTSVASLWKADSSFEGTQSGLHLSFKTQHVNEHRCICECLQPYLNLLKP